MAKNKFNVISAAWTTGILSSIIRLLDDKVIPQACLDEDQRNDLKAVLIIIRRVHDEVNKEVEDASNWRDGA